MRVETHVGENNTKVFEKIIMRMDTYVYGHVCVWACMPVQKYLSVRDQYMECIGAICVCVSTKHLCV